MAAARPVSTSVPSGEPEMRLCANECFKSAYNSAANRQCASGEVSCYCRTTLFFQQVHECGLETCTTDELEESLNYLGRVWCPRNANIDASDLVEAVLRGEVVSALQPITSADMIVLSASRITDSVVISSIRDASTGPPKEVGVTNPSSTKASITDARETGSSTFATSRSGAPAAQTSSVTDQQSSTTVAEPSPNSGLSTGAKAGIGAGIAAVALILMAFGFVFWKRRKHHKKSVPPYLTGRSHDEVDGKAELAGTEAMEGSRFSLAPKPELDGDVKITPYVLADGMAEMEHHERRETIPELDSRPEPWNQTRELGTSENQHTVAPALSTTTNPHQHQSVAQPPLAGPIPAASDLYPAPRPQSTGAAAASGAIIAEDSETDFDYQERRLRERRAIIAERKRLAEEEEQIAMEEEALRRKRAAAQSGR